MYQAQTHFTACSIIVHTYKYTTYVHTHLFDELLREGAGGAKRLDLESHGLLGLGVKGRVLYQAVDKHPQVALDVEWLEVHPSLVLLLGSLQ